MDKTYKCNFFFWFAFVNDDKPQVNNISLFCFLNNILHTYYDFINEKKRETQKCIKTFKNIIIYTQKCIRSGVEAAVLFSETHDKGV